MYHTSTKSEERVNHIPLVSAGSSWMKTKDMIINTPQIGNILIYQEFNWFIYL